MNFHIGLNRRQTYMLGPGALLVCVFAAAAGVYQAVRSSAAAPQSMAAMLPQGALLTIESPDFGTLLREWNASSEQRAWLASDNYSVFSRSHLFGRLDDARREFEAAAKASPRADTTLNGDFLTHVAGHQSIFAWYDVGNLEFLYITRIDAAQAANLSLMKDRASWSARQAGGTTFYMRKSSAAAPPASDEAADDQAASAQGKARTVAFAQVHDAGGDLLLLATREDLIANALELMHPAAGANNASVANEPWFSDAAAAQPQNRNAPMLHMVLNLHRLVPLPYFRSYWVQRNVSEMAHYRAAVSDLYRESGSFREQRALLLEQPNTESVQADLDSLAMLVPTSGAFRAMATTNADDAVTMLAEKLLGQVELADAPEQDAPDPSLDVPETGTGASDYETRIDTPAPMTAATSNKALAQALTSAGLDAVVTYSSAQLPATSTGVWVPMHSAVVLHATSNWNAQALAAALQQSLRGSLTAAALGIEFRPESANGATIYTLNGPKPLFFATSGAVCLLADDRALLQSMLLESTRARASDRRPATIIAGFDHTTQRAPFARLTSLIDGTNHAPAATDAHVEPAYFSGNLRSLSEAFAALGSERFEERRDGATVRQTVAYQWQTP
jgi:hypothetical protein